VGSAVRPGERRVADVGTPLAGTEVVIRDDDGAELPPDRVGRIWVRGPTLMREYLGQPEATAAALRDGWLDTGDLGFAMDGRLHIVGRAKDAIVIRGANHWPEEFETCLAGVAGVRPGRALAAGIVPPDAEGEVLLMLVERARGAPPGNDAAVARTIGRTVRERTGVHPHEVVLLAPGTLPRTSSGKLRRAEALQRFQRGSLTPPKRTDAVALAGELVRSVVGFARARWRP
jgi:acyl-CoA synthetase (AMP-forming)/AMP-acid ligase II